MGVLEITAVAVGLSSLLHWVIIPRLRRNLRVPRPDRPLRLVIFLVLANLLRSASLIAAFSFGMIVLILLSCAMVGYALPTEELAKLFRASSELREKVEALDKGWSVLTIGVLCIALWISVRRDAVRQVSRAVDASITKLKADIAAGRVERLEPTPEMQKVAALLDQLQSSIDANNARTPPDAAQAAELARRADGLRQELTRLDAVRRLDIGSELTALIAPPRPQNRFGAAMVSAGLLQPLSLISKAIAAVSLGLLAPALITLAGDELGKSIEQVNAQLHRLIVAQSREEAERDWLRNQPPPPQPRQVSSPDQALIRQLSYHYQAYARLHVNSEYKVPAHGFSLASTDVRQEILHNYAAQNPSLEVHGGTPAKRDEAGILSHAAQIDDDGPEAARFRHVLTNFARSTPEGEWDQFRHRATAFLQAVAKPTPTADVAQRLFAEVLNMGGSFALPTGSDSSALRDVLSELNKPGDMAETAADLMDLDIIRFATGIRDTGTPAAAKPDLPFGASRYDDRSKQWGNTVRDNLSSLVVRTEDDVKDSPPTLDQRPAPEADTKRALNAARVLMREADGASGAARASDVVSTYRDVFPGVVGDEGTTIRATLLREFPQAAVAAGQNAAGEATHAFLRARSYAALRGFSKIGGVLIGLLPNGGPDQEITGLDWNDTPTGVMLSLQTAAGKVLTFGPFRAEIVRMALAYASDGRPVTATMPLTPIGRQVLLHPALVDTALGCEARLIDQFVDGATSDDDARVTAANQVYTDLALYEVAWAVQFQHLDQPSFTGPDARSAEFLSRLRKAAAEMVKDQKLEKAAQISLSKPQGWSNPELSPMLRKKEYFDPTLVSSIGRCVANNSSMARFKGCIANQDASSQYIESSDWAVPPPQLRVESGVREATYQLGDDLAFLDLHRSRADLLWPFDFMVQVTFESPPRDANASEDDTHPFEFPLLKPHIHDAVAKSVASGLFGTMDAPRVLADLREFAVLQRLFRLALTGHLGSSFSTSTICRTREGCTPRVTSRGEDTEMEYLCGGAVRSTEAGRPWRRTRLAWLRTRPIAI
jgi:hypothetical protein